jgi:hypothetical protein
MVQAQTAASFYKKLDRTIGFLSKTPIFRRKWAKIAENYDYDHNNGHRPFKTLPI